MVSEKFKILSLDGGGIRGLYSAVILKKIEECFDIKLKEYFDLIVGTSTGSILASAIALDISLDEVIKIYEEEGKKIFHKTIFRCGLFRSKYNNKHLGKILSKTFGDIELGKIDKPLMIIASDVLNGSVYIHKSNYPSSDEYVRDATTPLAEAVLSSCSAPIYFNPFRMKNKYLLADGGLWANNPSIIGLTEAMTEKKFNKKIENIKILSIGTGDTNLQYDKNKKCWGFINGWKIGNLIEYILQLSTQSSTNMSSLILGDNYLRVNSSINHQIDKVEGLDNLKVFADKCFLEHRDEIKKMLNLNYKENIS